MPRARGPARLWIPRRPLPPLPSSSAHSSLPQTRLFAPQLVPAPSLSQAVPHPSQAGPAPRSLTPSSWARNTPLAFLGLSLRRGSWSCRPLGPPPAGWRGCPGPAGLEVRTPGCAVPTGPGDVAVPGEGAGESELGWRVFRAPFHPLLALPQAGGAQAAGS